jgi:hypothetical protein
MNRSTRAIWAATALFLSLACSSVTAQVRRDARLREALDAHRFQQPLSVVWPAALRLLADHHYQLVGHDRAAVGAPEESRWRVLTARGFATRKVSDHGLVLETRENESRTRCRVEAIETSPGACRVTFTAVRRTGEVPSEEKSRDLDLELELVRRLEPDSAARVLQAVDSTSR